MEYPAFILSCGWRSGSTLLQRLVNSHPDFLIYGENRNILAHLMKSRDIITGLASYGTRHAENFRKHGSNGWIAAMNPPLERFDDGLRGLLENYYKCPAADLGRTRWGFKEVRCGVDVARFIHGLYPEARFIFLIRNPEDCLASARALSVPPVLEGVLHESGGPRPFLGHWEALATGLHREGGDLPCEVIRYEDLVADPGREMAKIASLLGTTVGAFDLSVLEVRRRGGLGLPPRLSREDRECLKSHSLWKAAGLFGYKPSARMVEGDGVEVDRPRSR